MWWCSELNELASSLRIYFSWPILLVTGLLADLAGQDLHVLLYFYYVSLSPTGFYLTLNVFFSQQYMQATASQLCSGCTLGPHNIMLSKQGQPTCIPINSMKNFETVI